MNVFDAGGEEAARLICLRLLATAPRTRAQLAKELRRRKVPQDVSESVLGRFAEVGLIDDAAFARAWVESRHHGRGLARRVLAAELRQRGVPAENVKDAVSALDPHDELATARGLVAKRLAASRGSDFHSPGESHTDLGQLPYLPGELSPVWELVADRIR